MSKVTEVEALEVLDSRGNPTVRARVTTEMGAEGSATVPAGASRGSKEAVELRDGEPRYGGKGVRSALFSIEAHIRPEVVGRDVRAQAEIDEAMIALDGTPEKRVLGANSVLAVSMACARAAAVESGLPLYRYIGGLSARLLPVPMMNVINGGVHADNDLDLQEFMIVPGGAPSFSEALRMGVEVYKALGSVLRAGGHHTNVGDEGGYAPSLGSPRNALDTLMRAIEVAGLTGSEVRVAVDGACSELYQDGQYTLEGKKLTSQEMVEFWRALVEAYPIVSIEDPLAEDDWEGWRELRDAVGGRVRLVGDDLFVTNPVLIAKGVRQGVANAVLVKLNQVGTLTETLQAIEMTLRAGWTAIVSHRSGESEDAFIADLAVGVGCGAIKAGAPARSDRVAKYNRLLEIERELGPSARFAGFDAFLGPLGGPYHGLDELVS